MWEIIKDKIGNEIDNIAYLAVGMVLMCVVGFMPDLAAEVKAMATALFGAIMIKVKGA